MELEALCDSYRCCGKFVYNYSAMKVKDVSPNQLNCPDCGAVLFWKKKNSRRPSAKSNKAGYKPRHDLNGESDA